MAALDTTSLDNRAAGAGTHARPKAVLTLASSNVWLIRAFHDRGFRSEDLEVAP